MQARDQQRKEQFAMITSWQQSGLSQKTYCLQNNIAYHIFHYWYKIYRDQHAAGTASFISVNIPPPLQANVEMQLADGRRIIFHQPVSVDYLKALIA